LTKNFSPTVVVVGLGYVGLPLAIALARKFPVIGLDINGDRVAELLTGVDRTGEISAAILRETSLKLTSAPEICAGAAIYIVTVPTPVNADNEPDLRPVIAASKAVGTLLDGSVKPIVIYESTVYPGVTEDICGPLIEETSGLVCGRDFFLGYSPERINPGDREHTVDRIIKVVAGQNVEVTDKMANLYGEITSAGVFRAASIKAAEAAKVIENAQRDVNIAFMNEITQIFATIDLSIWDVLDAASTKWNFLPFQPGLVGGHCIGVDPYYLSHMATQRGHEPRIILAGRQINDNMAEWIVARLHAARGGGVGRALVMGVTFKENVPDIRNSKAVDIVRSLQKRGYDVAVHDPLADAAELLHEYGLQLDTSALDQSYDLVVCVVPHVEYKDLDDARLAALVRPGALIADIRGVWRDRALDPALRVWVL
jgi:UDP-N-acetyl-D-galactosamine dehydrogenase